MQSSAFKRIGHMRKNLSENKNKNFKHCKGLSARQIFLSLVFLFSAYSPLAAQAQDVGPSGPIDIKADEQEFAQDQIIAKGRVKVVYGDTVIHAPKATLLRDEAGQPKVAIFVGKPTLKQAQNIIKADKLTFEIQSALIIAEGRAHSEVITSGLGQEDEESADKEEQEQKAAFNDKPDKIITFSDKQIYEQNTGKFEAMGNVHVKTGDIEVDSKNLKLLYGTDNKAEAVLFTGDVTAKRDKNVTQSDSMTYFLATQRLQATGHVRSRVIQDKPPKASLPQDKKGPAIAAVPNSNSSSNSNSKSSPNQPTKILDLGVADGPSEILLISDAQDYNKETGRVDAEGNVQLYFKDTVGKGPRVTMLNDEHGQADRVIFFGRSQITQPGRKWIGDRITMTMDDRKVLAEGNTRAIIVKSPAAKPPSQLFSVPLPDLRSNPEKPSRLAGGGGMMR